jgi:hypothetical protein
VRYQAALRPEPFLTRELLAQQERRAL